MTIPSARAVQLAVAAQLRTILKANGYRTDAGRAVMTGAGRIPDGSVVMALGAVEEQSTGRAGNNALRCQMNMTATAQVDGIDDDALDLAHAVLADIKRALKTFTPPAGLLRGVAQYRTGRVDPLPEEGVDVTLVSVEIGVEYDDPAD